METRPICILHYKQNNKNNHQLTNKHLAANSQHHCQHCQRILTLANKNTHLQSDEHKKNEKYGIVKYVESI